MHPRVSLLTLEYSPFTESCPVLPMVLASLSKFSSCFSSDLIIALAFTGLTAKSVKSTRTLSPVSRSVPCLFAFVADFTHRSLLLSIEPSVNHGSFIDSRSFFSRRLMLAKTKTQSMCCEREIFRVFRKLYQDRQLCHRAGSLFQDCASNPPQLAERPGFKHIPGFLLKTRHCWQGR